MRLIRAFKSIVRRETFQIELHSVEVGVMWEHERMERLKGSKERGKMGPQSTMHLKDKWF